MNRFRQRNPNTVTQRNEELLKQLRVKVEKFNNEFPIGCRVHYNPRKGMDEEGTGRIFFKKKVYHIASRAIILPTTQIVVRLEELPTSCSITHISHAKKAFQSA